MPALLLASALIIGADPGAAKRYLLSIVAIVVTVILIKAISNRR